MRIIVCFLLLLFELASGQLRDAFFRAMHEAARAGDASVVASLVSDFGGDVATALENKYFDTSIGPPFQLTPLMMASKHGHVDVIKTLIQAGAKVDTTDCIDKRCGGKFTALLHAAKSNMSTAVRTLLAHGADPDAQSAPGLFTSLMFAAQSGYVDVVAALIDGERKVNANLRRRARSGPGSTAAVVSNVGLGATALWLTIEAIAPSDALQKDVPLASRLRIIELLLTAGADPLLPVATNVGSAPTVVGDYTDEDADEQPEWSSKSAIDLAEQLGPEAWEVVQMLTDAVKHRDEL